ncbi:Midasin [Schistosoma japonicum]|nr:Midasin [Schistosoma japonicum]
MCEEAAVRCPEDICTANREWTDCDKNPFVLFSRLDDVESAVKKSLDRCEPILIGGPVGSGKSSFANKLAKDFCNAVRTIQISEHTDAKTLLGAYCCTEIPGQFYWRPGPLISSIKQGYGLVLEDIDRGSSELQLLITSVLKKLRDHPANSKNGILLDPVSSNPVIHHPNFRLIMTRRFVSCYDDFRQESENPLTEFLDRYCFVISLPNFSKDEIRLLIKQKFPTLTPVIDCIMNIYTTVLEYFRNNGISAQHVSSSSRMRTTSLRDLLKFCSRISLLTEKDNFSELLLLNAADCFLCSMDNCVRQLELACLLAGELNLSVENARNILCCRSIEISLHVQKSILKAGRTVLPCRRTPEWETKVSGGSSIVHSSNDIIWPFASTHLSSSLLERLAVAVRHKEPILLVGETGTGKTSTVQRLAYLTGHRLRVINLNQQSDSIDLMGGFKPVDFQVFVRPLREKFESLFTCTFKLDNNLTFLGHINACFNSERWIDLITLMRHPARVAVQRHDSTDTSEWTKFLSDLTILERRLENITKSNKPGLGFAFIEGALVRAVQEGDWILLDEINLAPAEMLDSLSGLLDSDDDEPLKRHSDFHLFAAMNPATDIGKRELPVGLRNRFTEFYIPELDPGIGVEKLGTSPDFDSSRHIEALRSNNCQDLATLARSYLVALNPTPSQLTTIVKLYSSLRQAALEGLVDGVGQRPHFSLRTLCRALIEAGRGYHGSILRSLYEGLLFSFGSQICRTSRPILDTLIQRYLCSGWNKDSVSMLRLLNTPLPMPQLNSNNNTDISETKCPNYNFVNIEGYWLPRGPQQPISVHNEDELPGNYILTPSVQANLKDLARVVSARGGLPVLLQGETSVGKTSLITYLAKRVGQVCYRINNHEHTDQQTYLGTYTVPSASQTSKNNSGSNESLQTSTPLVFKDGLLVKAMRNGYWIILDELNLAPTEILEALNRVLDDNRSVFITETQETVKAHPNFRLFATQNPPGLYAGRKMLSRALRNRFIELHFDTIPRNELEIILEKKCLLPSSRAQRLVEVMHRLQLARCSSNLFQGKDSFITLRDLFRWAERYRLFDLNESTSPVVYEFLQPVLNKDTIYNQHDYDHIVWTKDMRRLLVLIGNALKYKEPILLVGETGCGKTTICQLIAALHNQHLHCVNCHQCTEASDFLGGLRPVRHSSENEFTEDDCRLFEWVNGPLVTAMLNGDIFLLDEISLADDAVLERLNSLLEPERQLHLAECTEDFIIDCNNPLNSTQLLTAHPKFRFIATMNPGGDYGKKELSPALRNRFTEIWCPSPVFASMITSAIPLLSNVSDQLSDSFSNCQQIVEHNLRLKIPTYFKADSDFARQFSEKMINFIHWFAVAQNECKASRVGAFHQRPPPTIRDLIAWIEFMQTVVTTSLTNQSSLMMDLFSACIHGACLLFLDVIDQTPNISSDVQSDIGLESTAIRFLVDQLYSISEALIEKIQPPVLSADDIYANFTIGINEQFVLKKDNQIFGCEPFFIPAGPCINSLTNNNFIFDAPTPASNLKRLLRAMQLPARALLLEVEGAKAGVFAWKSGPFLQGLCEGHWIILDEMNLASQSVLESLNACLDHRGEVFIPELNTSFKINSKATRLFACQNPLSEGGGRKGLPRSFLNRFTQVNKRINIEHEFGSQGGPWEFNLRDLIRWCDLLIKSKDFEGLNPGLYVHLLYTDRLRTLQDKLKMVNLWTDVCTTLNMSDMFYYEPCGDLRLFNGYLQCGLANFTCHSSNYPVCEEVKHLLLMDCQRSVLESFLKVIEMGWMVMLIGPPGCGKRTLAYIASVLLGQTMMTMCLSPNSDTIELLGSLEQRESGGLFEWIDSPLVKGIVHGYWVLIENAQLCSPSVLDRLNSLLEPNGELLLSERGLDAQGKLITLKAHPNFRLILTVDEYIGMISGGVCSTGISRAMRNRGLEITFTEPILHSHVDLLRLFTSTNVPKQIAIGLVQFNTLYLEACENPSFFFECYSHCFSTNHHQQQQMLKNNTSQCISGHHLKKIPIGALISAGYYARQLSTEPNQLVPFLPVEKETDKSRKKRKLMRMTTTKIKKGMSGDVYEKSDYDDSTSNVEKDITNEILIHILQFAYCQRQTHTKSIELVKYLIDYYVKHIMHTDELPSTIDLRFTFHRLPVNYLHHTVNDLIQNRLPINYRHSYANLINLTLKEYYNNHEKSTNTDLLLIVRRILLEQANVTDLQTMENDMNHVIVHFGLKTLKYDESDLSIMRPSDWLAWPDLRWIPGWKHLIGSLVEDPDTLIYEWNTFSKSIMKFSIQALVPITHSSLTKIYHLLINELIESTYECINGRLMIENESYSLSDLCKIPVLKITKLCKENSIPVIWLDQYPGLSNLFEEWSSFLKRLWNHFPGFDRSKSVDQFSLYSSVELISKAWSWLRLFGSRPLGDPFDWPERQSFHNKHILVASSNDYLPDLTTISQYFLPKSIPLNPKICQLQFSSFTVDWIRFGQLMDEFQMRFKTELTSNCSDSSDNDEVNVEEMDTVNIDVKMVDSNHNDIQSNMMKFYCLWPWTMILLSKFIEMQLLMYEVQYKDHYPHNPNSPTESLRIYIRSCMLTLIRPQLLAYLLMTQCSLKVTTCEQARVVKQLSQEFNITSVDNNNSSIFVKLSFKNLDWSLPNQLLNLHSVNQESTIIPNIDDDMDSVHSTILVGSLFELLNWIHTVFKPFIDHLKLFQSSDKSNNWYRIMRLIELLINLLQQLLSIEQSTNNNNDINYQFLLSNCWLLIGCLYLRCNCPYSPLDPYIVIQVEEKAVRNEIVSITNELDFRENMLRLTTGAHNCLLPSLKNANQLNVNGLVDCGLLHPWLGVLINRQHHLKHKAEMLKHRLGGSSCSEDILVTRQNSNFQAKAYSIYFSVSAMYVEIRRRITSFITDFTEDFLLVHCFNTFNNNNSIEVIENNLGLQKIHRWIEATSNLGDWLTEPNRLNTFADIITPVLYGLFYVSK